MKRIYKIYTKDGFIFNTTRYQEDGVEIAFELNGSIIRTRLENVKAIVKPKNVI